MESIGASMARSSLFFGPTPPTLRQVEDPGEETMSQNLLTVHATLRSHGRRIPMDAIEAAFDFGRLVHVRGAEVYAIGRREVAEAERDGVDLSAYEGVHVICSVDGRVLTVYRNHDLSGLRRDGRRHRRAA